MIFHRITQLQDLISLDLHNEPKVKHVIAQLRVSLSGCQYVNDSKNSEDSRHSDAICGGRYGGSATARGNEKGRRTYVLCLQIYSLRVRRLKVTISCNEDPETSTFSKSGVHELRLRDL